MTEPTPPPVPPYGAVPPPVPGAGQPVAPGSPPPPGYPAPGGHPASPGYPVPSGYPAPPAYQAPPGAYAVPVGGYQAPAGGYRVPPAGPPASRMLGIAALIAALLAAIVAPILGGLFGFQIGTRVPGADLLETAGDDLSILTPARLQVLWAEIAFWAGTALGLLAIVLGIIAASRRRGRGFGITAIVLAALGPVFFFLATFVMLAVGAAAASVPAV